MSVAAAASPTVMTSSLTRRAAGSCAAPFPIAPLAICQIALGSPRALASFATFVRTWSLFTLDVVRFRRCLNLSLSPLFAAASRSFMKVRVSSER